MPKFLTGWYRSLALRYYFKFILPRIRIATVEGIRLDVSSLPLLVRNRIINVGYEEPEKRLCARFLDRDDSVLELGGAIGFLGLYCQRWLGISRYITVEANPVTAQILRRNYRLNHRTPTLWQVAVGPHAGTVRLNVGGEFWSNRISADDSPGRENTVEVPSMPLPALLDKAGDTVNSLIIDIEGAEQFIDFAALPPRVAKVIIELHPAVIGREGAARVIASLRAGGFEQAAEDEGTFAFLRKTTGGTAPS